MLRTVTCSPSNMLRPMACTLYISLKSGGDTACASHGDTACAVSPSGLLYPFDETNSCRRDGVAWHTHRNHARAHPARKSTVPTPAAEPGKVAVAGHRTKSRLPVLPLPPWGEVAGHGTKSRLPADATPTVEHHRTKSRLSGSCHPHGGAAGHGFTAAAAAAAPGAPRLALPADDLVYARLAVADCCA